MAGKKGNRFISTVPQQYVSNDTWPKNGNTGLTDYYFEIQVYNIDIFYLLHLGNFNKRLNNILKSYLCEI